MGESSPAKANLLSRNGVALSQSPPTADAARPSAARVYDCLLGGKDNYAVDRRLADQLLKIHPYLGAAARANRAFVVRAVRFLAQQGIHQFLDLGCGLPTHDNVHQVAERHAYNARVVYVDHDPIVLAHARALLAEGGSVAVVQADLRKPGQILDAVGLGPLIDFRAPVAVLLTAVLHHIEEEDDPYGIVRELREALAPGSALVISHATSDVSPAESAEVASHYSRECTSPLIHRSRSQVRRFFGDFELADPGLVFTTRWRPDIEPLPPEQALSYAGVGIRRTS